MIHTAGAALAVTDMQCPKLCCADNADDGGDGEDDGDGGDGGDGEDGDEDMMKPK